MTASGDQAKVVCISAADDVLLVSVSFTTLDKLTRCLVVHLLIHMDLDGLIPAAGDDRVVTTTSIANKADLAITKVMLFKAKDFDARLQVIELELTLRATNDHLAMTLIEGHARDLVAYREHILHNADRLA